MAPPRASRILIAADSPTEALAVEGMLRSGGHVDVRVTSDAREIGPLYSKWPFHLLILDMRMSTLSGLDVLHAFNPYIARGRVGVLVVTHAGEHALVDTALDAGASGVLTRPITRTTALENVHAILSKMVQAPSGGPTLRRTRRRFSVML